jgi:tetratricopeptide (TPR) repeat protein
MATITKAKTRGQVQKLLQQLGDAQEALERNQHKDARQKFEAVRAVAVRQGIRSGHVSWALAVAHDYLGMLEDAMGYIREALELDPLAGPYNRSFEVICNRVRAELLREDRSPVDESTPRLYQLLVQASVTGDEAVHLVQARYLLATGNREAALKLIEAVTTLFPLSSDAWALRAKIALAMGDHEGAALAIAEAATLGEEPVPFAVPGRAEG